MNNAKIGTYVVGVAFVLVGLFGLYSPAVTNAKESLTLSIGGNFVWAYWILGVAAIAVGFLLEGPSLRVTSMISGAVLVVAGLLGFVAPADWNVLGGDIAMALVAGAVLALGGWLGDREPSRETRGRPAT